MAKLTITKRKLLKEYKSSTDRIAEDIEWKTSFSGEEVCNIVYDILTKNKVKTSLTAPKLHEIYLSKVKQVSTKIWCEQYGIPEIIDIIYGILKENT